MKLSEVIKAIEGGRKSEFKSDRFKIETDIVHGELGVKVSTDYDAMHFPVLWWEEIKPPRQWSDDEKKLIELFPDGIKWIAKDKYDSCYAYKRKPVLSGGQFYSTGEDADDIFYLGKFGKILTITFEESPVYIGDLKGE